MCILYINKLYIYYVYCIYKLYLFYFLYIFIKQIIDFKQLSILYYKLYFKIDFVFTISRNDNMIMLSECAVREYLYTQSYRDEVSSTR